ncbi:TetR/AcrR family transcriptional regulator [Parvibaculaceae bacterium PLY_AMNH_Bact1]|nr:TetR/AcrR family transcriptional regulator [Parvibaculaceae bacterium PLY_AMNH_Bact1]
MPKIVDHQKYRREIVEKATPVFSEHGFSGLGMRQIAKELGISKSALYHYFPSKEILFAACTEYVVERDGELFSEPLQGATVEQKISVLMSVFKGIEEGFQGEAFLLLDYMRGMSHRDVARDKNMKLANKRYLEMTTAIVGKEAAQKVLVFLLGALLQRLLNGRGTSLEDIKYWLREVISEQPRETE